MNNLIRKNNSDNILPGKTTPSLFMRTFRVNESIFINALLSWLPTPSRRGNLWHFHRQKWQIFYWFTYILSDEDMFFKVSSTFLWKTKRRALLKNYWRFSEKHRLWGPVSLNFFSLLYSENWRFTWNNFP